VHAEKLAYIVNNQVIDIIDSSNEERKSHPRFKDKLVPIADEFNEGDFICDGKKMIRPDRKARLNNKCEWEYSLEDLEAEKEAALDRAIVQELKEIASKQTITNRELQKAFVLLMRKFNIIEKE
jgi:hypothetical protein